MTEPETGPADEIPQGETSQDEAPHDESPRDATRRRFREALDRKKAKSAGAAGHQEGRGPQSRAHGPAGNRREFRRKSG